MDGRNGPVIGVVGGSGGIGASCFAVVLAVLAAAVLVDLDPSAGGIDVLLGIETQPGARWSGLHVAGGHLDPDVLAAGLPRAGPCAVLAADTAALDAAAVLQVLGAATALGPVVLDLPRTPGEAGEAGVASCDLLVVLTRSDVAGLVAAHATLAGLDAPRAGVVARRGDVAPDEAARLVGAPLLGVLPRLSRRGAPLDLHRPPRALATVAAGVLAGLAPRAPAAIR